MAQLGVRAVPGSELRRETDACASAHGASSFTSPKLAVSLRPRLRHKDQSLDGSAVHATHDLQHATTASDC